jgi:metacaspase-1
MEKVVQEGLALTIGLNAVSPANYSGWDGKLCACEADAQDMAQIAKTSGFQVKTLLTKEATRKNVIDEISKTASDLKSGDIFMLTYSGHGGQLPDLNFDEPDGKDETWCLYDGELVDDEIYSLLSRFAPGVRIITFSDSCHSGSVLKGALHATLTSKPASGFANEPRYKYMPRDIEMRVYRDNKEFYDAILLNKELAKSAEKIQASALLISGCMDNQFSQDGTFNGLFTGTLLKVWNNGKFKPKGRLKGYKAFRNAILALMPPDQTPNYFYLGNPNSNFESQNPFTI